MIQFHYEAEHHKIWQLKVWHFLKFMSDLDFNFSTERKGTERHPSSKNKV